MIQIPSGQSAAVRSQDRSGREIALHTMPDTLRDDGALRDALVLRAIAARLRSRAVTPQLRRLADLDAALIEQVASNVEGEYTR